MNDIYQVIEIAPKELYLLTSDEKLPEGKTLFTGTLNECLNRFPKQKFKKFYEYNLNSGNIDNQLIKPKTFVDSNELPKDNIKTGNESYGQNIYQ